MNYSMPDIRPSEALAPARVLDHAGIITPSDEVFERQRIVGFDSHDERARAFNLLRTQITRALEGEKLRILGITSATPGAGKTYVSVNLAAALSRISGRSVLLCDFDLRRGSVLESFEAEVPVDLSAYLRGENDSWREAIYRIADTDLYILSCIAALRKSGQLLSSDRFARMIAELRTLPDDVIILGDLPPVFASDDALLTMEHLDGYLMVVEHGRNTPSQVRETMALLETSSCIGTVLNRYRGGFFDAYGYGYGDPYGIKNYGKQHRR